MTETSGIYKIPLVEPKIKILNGDVFQLTCDKNGTRYDGIEEKPIHITAKFFQNVNGEPQTRGVKWEYATNNLKDKDSSRS